MTAETMPDAIDWPWPGQIAAGHFQELVHRVRPGARTIHIDGVTYHVADCGAIAVPTNEPPEEWDFCGSCWPCGVAADAAPPSAQPPTEPTARPDCLDWGSTYGTSSAHQPEPPLLVAISLTTASPTPNGMRREVGWFEALT